MLPAAVPGIRQPIQAHHPHTRKQNIMALLGAGGVLADKRMTWHLSGACVQHYVSMIPGMGVDHL